MSYRFLLVGDPKQPWRKKLREAVAPLGQLHVLTEEEARARTDGTGFHVVVVDATKVERVEELVTRYSSQLDPPYIIVVTADPTWQDALKVFRAGATDYVRKYNEKDRLARFFYELLAAPAV